MILSIKSMNYKRALLEQQERWICWIPVPVGIGIGAYFSLRSEPPMFLGAVGLVIMLAALSVVYERRKFLLYWLFLFLVVLGFAASQVRTWSVGTYMLQKKTYPLILQGRVVETEVLPKAVRITLDGLEIKGGVEQGEEAPQIPHMARIKLRGKNIALPQSGDVVEVKAVLLPISPPVLPDAFDFQRHAYFKGLGATGYSVGEIRVVQPRESGFFFANIRHIIRDKVDKAVADKDTAAIITALLTGENDAISDKTWEAIRLSGIAHLLAISGFNITIVTGFIFFLVRAVLAAFPIVALRYPIKKIAAGAALCGGVFYLLLIGDILPATRSVIMVCVVMLAVMMDRDPFSLRLASFAALVIILLEPEALLGPSFQLSFSAVVALISFYEGTRNMWSKLSQEHGIVRRYSIYILGSAVTTLIATAATAPFSAYYFSRVPLFSGLVTNMIAVPVSAFVTIPAGFMACFLMPFHLEHIPLWLAERSVEVIMKTASLTAQWSVAVVRTEEWPLYVLVLMTMGGLWLCLWRGALRWWGVLPFVVAPFLVYMAPEPDVLLSQNAKLFAVRGDEGKLWISSARREKFVATSWIEKQGGAGVQYWPANGSMGRKRLMLCSDQGDCVYKNGQQSVRFIQTAEAGINACQDASVLVSAEPLHLRDNECPNTRRIFDKWYLKDNGATKVFFEGGDMRVVTTRDVRGVRPWTDKPYQKKTVEDGTEGEDSEEN